LDLVGPAGLVSAVQQLPIPSGDPAFAVYTASLGDLSQPLPELRLAIERESNTGLDGAGSDFDPAVARWKSVAEALERYSSCTYSPQQFRWATAAELGDEAIDLDTCPTISAAESADPQCFVVPPDKHAPMRWVRGVALSDGRLRWIPAMMVYLHLPYASRGERFTLPISTGCAAHTDLYEAVARGLSEVVERDSIAISWLQQLGLPQIELDEVSPALEPFLRPGRNSPHVRTYLFDATTDLGIPTIYSVEQSPHHSTVRTVVMAATDTDVEAAIGKVLREAASGRIALRYRKPNLTEPKDFVSVHDGALYMGAPDRAHAFDFLTRSDRRVKLSQLPRHRLTTSRERLEFILARLSAAGHEAYVVDLTTDEAERSGVWVVKAIVPGLQPLSFVHRAQFRGHRRLYDAPAAMGHAVHPESDLNPWPQPFA
jgi:ribosomal protein S12 methylthiotransferase accessory factor